ncbi:MAG: YIP1 family protein [Dysgonamonadaceae bacterium]|jgi:hypothetical protein|nr:YIP1 family protein [Dysgonamonadaceae bacterium]
MFISLFSKLFRLIVEPGKIWRELFPDRDSNNEDFYRNYFYPALGIIALLTFVGSFIGVKSFTDALKDVIRETVVFFVGFYLAVWGIVYLAKQRFGITLPVTVCEKFTGYSSAAVYVAAMTVALLPAFSILHVFALYAFVTVWHGVKNYLKTDNLREFSLYASLIIIFLPTILRYLLNVATK